MLVYIVKIESEDKYKIGFTKRKLEERIKGLQTGCPYNIIPIFEFDSKYATKLESYLHRSFSDKRLEGEWFSLTDKDLDNIEHKCEMFEKNMNTLSEQDNPFILKYLS